MGEQIHVVRAEHTHYKGVYLNGMLVLEGENINFWTLLQALGFEVTQEFKPDEWFAQFGGCCPQTLPHEQMYV